MRMPIRRVSTATRDLLACLALMLASHSNAQETQGDWLDHERLLAGEILVDFGEAVRFQGFIRAAVLVEARPERIWDILRDCPRAPEYVPHVVSCERVESRGDGLVQLFRQEVKYAWFLPRFEHVFSLRYQPHTRIEVERVSGPIEHMSGVWQLLPYARGILLTYDLELRPGLPVPSFVVGASLRHDLPIILTEVRERAEASPQPGP